LGWDTNEAAVSAVVVAVLDGRAAPPVAPAAAASSAASSVSEPLEKGHEERGLRGQR